MALTVEQLIAEPVLRLRLATPNVPRELRRRVHWVAPTELADPTPFLNGGELVLTTGAAIDADDTDAWEAYAGRLAGVPVAAVGFGTGLRHPEIPRALTRAARAAGLPLLEVPYSIPFVKISRFIADAVIADRFKDVARVSSLTSRLAAALSRGTLLWDLLRVIADDVEGPVAVLDGDGVVIASWPLHTEWTPVDALPGSAPPANSGTYAVGLDSAGGRDQVLVARSALAAQSVQATLSAAATLVAIDLSRRTEEASGGTRMAAFLDNLTDWTTPTAALARAMRAAGLTPDAPTLVIVGRPDASYSGSLRPRLTVPRVLPVVQSIRRGDGLVVFGQQADDEAAEAVLGLFAKEMPDRQIVVAGPARDAEQLRMVLASARGALGRSSRPCRARAFDIESIIASAAGRGGGAAGENFLAPLLSYDERVKGDLVKTLRAYLRADAQPGQTASRLHIHRNTLRYRLSRIEQLLGIDLDRVDDLVACSLAFQLRRQTAAHGS
ncbi:MAG TPA: PucR family transcriptional regulator ligand-binding domain-containing protein [Jiangellales bacterium]|nr:PucR family transcriptional regulator ligand-binding domain-containing protein [Jiangellales bacterium]